jgi:hypothetical protein
MTGEDWQRVEEELEMLPEGWYLEGSPHEGYCVRFPHGVIHPKSFLNMIDDDADPETIRPICPTDIIKKTP